jgi:uncharacterized protein
MGLNNKVKKLATLLEDCGSALVAFSGGVDSALLAVLARGILKGKCFAVTSVSPIHDGREMLEAQRLAKRHKLKHVLLRSKTPENKKFLQNTRDRCYICKRDIFSQIIAYAKKRGINAVLDGSNADDLKTFRPGRKALKEMKVRSPLAEAGLTKEDVRKLAKKIGIGVWNKPANACLATRIPYGARITVKVLEQIERAERALAGMGFVQCRVRHHGEVARIEVPVVQLNKALKLKDEINKALKDAGYKFITLDLAGYRSGSFDPKTATGKHGKR